MTKCKSCGGNNMDMPCAFPEGGQPQCLKYNSPVAMGHPGPDVDLQDYIDARKTADELRAELKFLRKKVKEQEERLSNYSWQTNPDRMGQ